jgi:flagellar biosynthetic protein FliR
METWVNSILTNADYFLLVMLRTGGLIFSSPIFGRTLMPARVKIGLVAAVGFLFFISFPSTAPIEYTSLFGFFLLCAAELLLGIALAFVTNLFFALTFVAGQLIDMQIGFGIVNVYDRQNNTQIPMIGNLLNTILLIVFFGVNGHHQLIGIIYLTLERLPVGSLVFAPEIGLVALEIFVRSFALGVMVAMPVIASGLILEISFGLLVKTVPQMNMFVVGIPIKIIIGFVIILFTLPVFINFSGRIFSEMFAGIEQMFAVMMERV